MTGTALTAYAIAELRIRARSEAGAFVDPARFGALRARYATFPPAWRYAILGRAVVTPRDLTWPECVLLLLAADADPVGLEQARAARTVDSREALQALVAALERRVTGRAEAWAALRARLPVPVEVWHNWTVRHVDGYEQGADHIVTLGALSVGRLARPARRPLCWTPSRAHQLRHVSPQPGDEARVPDCKACLRIAERIATPEEGSDG
jgi:hypothetical protein